MVRTLWLSGPREHPVLSRHRRLGASPASRHFAPVQDTSSHYHVGMQKSQRRVLAVNGHRSTSLSGSLTPLRLETLP